MEYEHVKAKSGPGKSVHHGSIERLFVRKHPGLLRQGEVEIVPVSEPEENVLQSRAPGLVGFSKCNLQIKWSTCGSSSCYLFPRETLSCES